jgi:hypothetical protein
MSANVPHQRRVGDTAKVYPFVCKYIDESGNTVFRDLTGATVQFSMINSATGVQKVAPTAATVTDAINGEGEYDFAAGDVDEAGIFWVTILVTVAGSEPDSYPVAPNDGVIWIHSPTQTAKQAYQSALMG